jgi:hypothetical protein
MSAAVVWAAAQDSARRAAAHLAHPQAHPAQVD